ncbi:MAG: cytochrome c3 family protein [Thermodesulfobacteriota bacterium]
MLKRMKVFSLGLGLLGFALTAPQFAVGKAQGPCVDCHTMHNSQNGVELIAAPQGALVNKTGGCIGCHTGSNTGLNNTPYVLSLTANYGSDTLAGGNFRWVQTNDTFGHNVLGVADVDAINTLGMTPPGWNTGFDANGQITMVGSWAQQLTCAGTYGCHGEHGDGSTLIDDFTAISGSHHADDAAIDGSTAAKSFRFLYGIIGYEDSDWEYTNDSTDHNQYYGYDRTNDTPPGVGSEGAKSINYLCAECHGDFHSGAADDKGADTANTAGSAWLRHPTDYDMNNLAITTEYRSYGDGGVGIYNPDVPVATDRAVALAAPVTDVFATAGDAIVNCISCHRAHGSPNADLLRWDYSTCSAGADSAACGCFACHTTKDAG